jgi:hypothetical protein
MTAIISLAVRLSTDLVSSSSAVGSRSIMGRHDSQLPDHLSCFPSLVPL